VLHPEDHVAAGSLMPRLRSAGRPAIGTRVRLVSPDGSEGTATGTPAEITVRSDSIMLGYWRRPELTAETIRDGWVHTGDLALADDEGFVFVVDRLQEMIITGGINVFPREIEDVIRSVKAVIEAAVIGVPSAAWGEQVVAFVTTDTGTDRKALRAAIQDACRERLAGYKVPRQIVIDTGQLPVTGSGKLAKAELRRRFLEPEAARRTAR
jgi:long-chain acyl-CoA synthetase